MRPRPIWKAREMRRSISVTDGSRSSPRGLRNTFCVARGVEIGTMARGTENEDAIGKPVFEIKLPAIRMAAGA